MCSPLNKSQLGSPNPLFHFFNGNDNIEQDLIRNISPSYSAGNSKIFERRDDVIKKKSATTSN